MCISVDKRYQVFVSSTYADLKEERSKIIHTLMELDCIPAGMELFPAADEEQFQFIKKIIDACDYYLIIIGGRYGSVTDDGVSYTEMEYDYALKRGIKVIALLHRNPGTLSLEKSENDQSQREKLQRFREKIAKGRLVKFWKTADELPGFVSVSLSKVIKDFPAIGWVRGGCTIGRDCHHFLNEEKVQEILVLFAGDAEEILVLGGDGSFLSSSNPQVDAFRKSKKILLNSHHRLSVERLKNLQDNGSVVRLYPDHTHQHGLRGAIKVTDHGMAACLFDRKGQQLKHQEIDNKHLVKLIYDDFTSIFNSGKNALIKCVIFDLAGVMFDGDVSHFFNAVEEITSANIVNESKHYLCVDEELNLGTINIINFIEKTLATELTSEQATAIKTKWSETWTINENVKDIAITLKMKGYTVALASNCDKENADLYERKQYLNVFDHLFMSCHMGQLKPSKQFFDLMLRRLSLWSCECLFIDDHRANIEVAKELGFNCILVDRGLDCEKRAKSIKQHLFCMNVYI